MHCGGFWLWPNLLSAVTHCIFQNTPVFFSQFFREPILPRFTIFWGPPVCTNVHQCPNWRTLPGRLSITWFYLTVTQSGDKSAVSYASWEELPRLPTKTHLLNRILLCRHNNPYHKCANIHSNWFWISMSFLSATLNFPVPENGEKTISEFNSWIYSSGLLFTNCVCIMYTNTNRQYEGTVKVFRSTMHTWRSEDGVYPKYSGLDFKFCWAY